MNVRVKRADSVAGNERRRVRDNERLIERLKDGLRGRWKGTTERKT